MLLLAFPVPKWTTVYSFFASPFIMTDSTRISWSNGHDGWRNRSRRQIAGIYGVKSKMAMKYLYLKARQIDFLSHGILFSRFFQGTDCACSFWWCDFHWLPHYDVKMSSIPLHALGKIRSMNWSQSPLCLGILLRLRFAVINAIQPTVRGYA